MVLEAVKVGRVGIGSMAGRNMRDGYLGAVIVETEVGASSEDEVL